MEHTVQQHRSMPAGQHKPIAPCPSRIGRVVSQVSCPQHVAKRRQGHGRAGMPAVGLLHGIHGKGSNCVDAQIVEGHAAHGDGLGHLPISSNGTAWRRRRMVRAGQ